MIAGHGFAAQGSVDPGLVFGLEPLAGVQDGDLQAVSRPPAGHGDLAAARRGDAVLHCVFQHRLDREQRYDAVVGLLIQIPLDDQVGAETLLDEIDVCFRYFHFILQGHHAAVLARHGGVQQHGQRGDHGGDGLGPVNAGLPVDILQGVVDEMGIDATLQRLDLGVFQVDFFLVGLVDQLF